MKERRLEDYFELFKGKSKLYSEMPSVIKPAVECMILDKKLVAQQRTFDKDELLVPTKELFEPIDLGEEI